MRVCSVNIMSLTILLRRDIGSLHDGSNVQPQTRPGLPPETHGSPSPEARRQAAASSVRFYLDGKWNGSRHVASDAPILLLLREKGPLFPRTHESRASRTP